ncbi:MAG: translocation/assembly module TamB [Bacteroidales bacterium]|nr:translocation/assembly module TamB [Bacteroidales bacterium]
MNTAIQIKSDIGSLEANINLGKQETSFLKGIVSSSSINLRDLLNNPDLGNTIFKVDMDIVQDKNKGVTGNINALVNEIYYRSYKYENINLLGKLTSNSFNGTLKAESPDGQINAEGLVVLDGEKSEFNFTAKASQILLDKLNLIKKYEEPELSFNIAANFTGNNAENMHGTIAIKNILFSTNKGGYTIDHINLISNRNEIENEWIIESSILNGSIKGDYSVGELVHSLKNTLSHYIPSIIAPPPSKITDNNFTLNLSINDTREFSYIFELPLTIYNQANIQGSYDSQTNNLKLNARFPYLRYNNYRIEDGQIELGNDDDPLNLKIKAVALQKNNNKLFLDTEFTFENDSIFSKLAWTDNKNGKYKGNMDFKTHLVLAKDNNPLSASVVFQPSNLVFNDSLWRVSPTIINYNDGNLHIDKFEASHNTQRIVIDGHITQNPADEILLDLTNVNLDYIFQSLNKKALTFGGVASGYVIAKDVYNTRQLSTQLNVKNFAFNYVELGDLKLNGRWIDEEEGIEMKGNVFKNDSSQVEVDGFIYPVKEEISILFDATNTDAAFLRKYLNNVVQDLSGELTGKLRLLGNLNDPTVEGDVFVKNGRFGIEFLNTQYSFSDWVKCTPDRISIKNALFYDKHGNKALINGYVNHNLFADFSFDANLTYEDFMIFDATSVTNPTFYGPVFGTGTASIKGTEDVVNIDVSMHNTANTHLTLNFMDEADIEEYNFINFVHKEEKDTIVDLTPWQFENTVSTQLHENSETDIRLNLLVNTNNQATVEMIMDPVSGDKITGIGNGSMQIQYGTKTPMKVMGTYTIERGRYNFSFQQALFRNFEIQDGSSVSFRGDPYTADLNIKAAYTVTANLGDLDQQLLQMSPRNNIPVNCVLLLSGPLQQPIIKFDIELPNSSAELERQVKSYIRTDEMLNRQIVYLLVLSRFYTSPEYSRGDVRFNNDLSYLTSTLSTQISNMLGGISDNFQLGTKFHQSSEGEETSTEVELLLSSTLLNNRLIINGNFGYIDNPYTYGNNNNLPLVGDFDIEYKLTKSGDIRLKGFNRYNYRNYFSTSPEMTQGVGILFRRDFDNLKDLFSRRRNLQIIALPREEETNDSAADPQIESTTE